MLAKIYLYAVVAALVLVTSHVAGAADLTINGAIAGPATCPGGTAVDTSCQVNATASLNRGCRFGGEHTFDVISVTNGGVICVTPFNGTDKVNTGNLVLKATVSITVDATSLITAKGDGYRDVNCGEGEGPNGTAGGRGGCSVRDSGGGGAHFGNGGRGTKDCFLVAPNDSCQFPNEWEEDCGNLNGAGTACVTATDPNFPVCYGTTNSANGAGNAGIHIAAGAGDHAGGEGAGVELVLGVEDQRLVQRAGVQLARATPVQQVQEMAGDAVVIGLDIDANMVNNPRMNPYVRTDGWDEEVARINAKKAAA